MLNPSYKEKSYTFNFLGDKATTDNFLDPPVTYTSGQYCFVLSSVSHHYYESALECELEMYKGSQLYYKDRVHYQSSNVVNTFEGGDITYNPSEIYEKMSDLLNKADYASNLVSMWDYLDWDNLIKNIID